MFRLKEIKTEINCLSLAKKWLCVNTKQEELFLNDVKLDTITSVCGYFFSNKYFVYSNKVDFTNTIIYLEESNRIQNIGKISLQFQKSDDQFVALHKVDGKRNLIIFDLDINQQKIIKEDISLGVKLLYNESLIANKGGETLISLSLVTGEYEWELDLEEYGQIGKIIGVCNDSLWVGVGSKMLIGIDIKNGKILHLIDKPSHFAYQSGDFNYFRGHDGQIDEKANKIVGFEYDTYYELDLATMEFTYWIFREEAKAMKIEARYAPQNIHKEEFIYFIDKLNFKIGIFDRKNKSIKEAYVFPENSCTGFLNDLQISDNKIYVLDTGGTLHILERSR